MTRAFLVLALFLGLAPRGSWADPPVATLDGVWEITGLIDDGDAASAKMIREGLAKDARLTIQGQSINLVRPRNREAVTLLFVNNPSASPATLDLAGVDKIGSKGIYLLSGDTAMICISGPGIDIRPTEFGSKEGSHTILMTLKRLPATPSTTVAAAPVKVVPNGLGEDTIRKMLLGTWGHQDEEKVELGTFNGDGSFSLTKTWKKGIKKLFDGDVRSSGEWTVRDGSLIVKITASTDKEFQGQIYSYRINTITDRDMLLIDAHGNARREWKTR